MTQPTTGLILMVTLVPVLVSAAVAADTLTITARQTVVRVGPESKQRILATVPQGTTLALLERRQGLAEAVEDFSRQLRPGSVGVFYYAGHGVQVGGRNYLIPLGARITTEAVVPYQAVAAEIVGMGAGLV